MKIIREFADKRRDILNPPAMASELDLPIGVGSIGSTGLGQLYEYFDGEVMWGAVLPGWRIDTIRSISELIMETSDSWEWFEEQRGEVHPMRGYLPFISTSRKTNIGLLSSSVSRYSGCVIEYSYETGKIFKFSSSLEDFINAMFDFSIQRIVPAPSIAASMKSYTFSDDDVAFLGNFKGINLPDCDGDFLDVEDL